MATIYWNGSISTDPDTAGNWDGGVPTSSDDVIFDSSSAGDRDCDLELATVQSISWLSMTVEDDFGEEVNFGASTILTLTAGGLTAKKAGWLRATDEGAKISFTGTAPFTDKLSDGTNGSLSYYVKFVGGDDGDTELDNSQNESGIFGGTTISPEDNSQVNDLTERGRFVFEYTPQPSAKLVFVNGVYPDISIVNPSSGTATLSPTFFYGTYDTTKIESRTHDTNYPKVRFRDFSITSNVTVSPDTKSFLDFNTWYEIAGTLTLSSDTFDWGYSTLELIPVLSVTYFPANGEAHYGGSDNKFNASYHNLVISPGPQENFAFYLKDGMVIACNSLRIDGKLYAAAVYGSTSSAEIHTIERPDINGDWNYQQIADGIYRARGTHPKAGVPSGGTGQEFVDKASLLYGDGHDALQKLSIGSEGQVLTVNSSSLPEWGEGSSGSGCGLLDIGSLLNDQDVTIHMGNLICS